MNRRENNSKLTEHKTQILLLYLQLSRKCLPLQQLLKKLSGMSEHIDTYSSSTIKYNHGLNTDVCYNITDVIINKNNPKLYITAILPLF